MRNLIFTIIFGICFTIVPPCQALDLDKYWQKTLGKIQNMPERTDPMLDLLNDMVPILMRYEECETVLKEFDDAQLEAMRTTIDNEKKLITMKRSINKSVKALPESRKRNDVLAAIKDWSAHFKRKNVDTESNVTAADLKKTKTKWKTVRQQMKKARIDPNIQANAKNMSAAIKRYRKSFADWKAKEAKYVQANAYATRSEFNFKGQRNRIGNGLAESGLSAADKNRIIKSLTKIEREMQERLQAFF